MNALLYSKTGALAGSEFHIGEDAVIGRQEEADVTLPSDAVSDRHARIFFSDEEDGYVIEDLDSGTGTRVDATEVVDSVPLTDLHVITFGESVDLIFQVVEEHVASRSAQTGSQTQFGIAPGAPSDLSDEDEAGGARTRFEESPAELPDLSEGSESEDVDRTRFGESAPELPDLSEEDESEADHTRMGDAPGTLPDLSDEESTPDDREEASEDVDRTRFGESAPELPDLSEGDDPAGDRTRMGDAPGTLPDPPDEEASDSSEGASEEGDSGAGEPPSERAERTGDEPGEDEVEQTKMGAAAPGLPDFSDDESSAEDEDEVPTGEDPSPSEAPTQEAPSQASPSAEYALHVYFENEPQDAYPLPEGEVTIGRSSECDIQVEDPGVSREHARFIVESGEVVVDDMGSKNFTFVDGHRLSGPTTLSLGSQIQFGLHVKAVLKHTSS